MCSSDEVGYCDDDEDKHPDEWHCICIPCDDDASDDSGDNSDDEEMEAEKRRCKYNISICFIFSMLANIDAFHQYVLNMC